MTSEPRATAALRGPKPRILGGSSISNFEMADLQTMVRWVVSDGRLRTNDEILSEVITELGFSRRGPRIVERVTAAIRLVQGAAGGR